METKEDDMRTKAGHPVSDSDHYLQGVTEITFAGKKWEQVWLQPEYVNFTIF